MKTVRKQMQDKLGTPLDCFDVSISDVSVIRLSRKLYAGEEVLDLRLWGRAKDGNLFPRKGQGMCMRAKNWVLALKLFADHSLPYIKEDNNELSGQ